MFLVNILKCSNTLVKNVH